MKKVLTLFLAIALSFTLASCTNKEDLANAEDAAQKLSVEVTDASAVTSNLTLPTEGLHDATIVWASDNETVIATDGTVTRPAYGEDDATVILTATITVGEESTEKALTFKVLADLNYVAATAKEVESSSFESGDLVKVSGIVVGIINTYGFQIYDGTGFTYIHEEKQPTVVIGDEVEVKGVKGTYNDSVQVASPASIEVLSTGNALPAFTEVTMDQIYGQDHATTDWYNDMFRAEGIAVIQGEYDNAYLTWFTQDLDLVQIEVYYKSGGQDRIDEIKALDGKKVEVDFILKDYSYGYRMTVNTTGEVVEAINYNNAERAKLAVAYNDMLFNSLGDEIFANLDLSTESEYVQFPVEQEDGTFEDEGVAMAWESSNTAVISNAGEVTLPSGTTETVDLTVTATYNGVTATKTYTVVVADKDTIVLTNVAGALEEVDGTVVLVEGVVTGFRYGRPFIQDADGTAMFIDGKLTVEYGDKIEVFGKIDHFAKYGNDMKSLDNAALVRIVSSDNTVAIDSTTTPAALAQNASMYHGQLFTMTLKYVETDSYGYYFFEGYTDTANAENNVSIKMDEDWFPELVANLDTNNEIEVTFNMYDVNFDNARIVPVMFGGLTAAQNLALVEPLIAIDAVVMGDLDLVTDVMLFGATITWTSTNSAIDPATGVVTLPAEGAADVTGDLVASIVFGSAAAVTETYAVTVPAPVAVSGGTENLDNLVDNGSSYGEGTYTGAQGIVWTFSRLRHFDNDGTYTIGGTGVSGMFASDGTRELSATIAGGIGDFSLDLRSGYTSGDETNRSVEVFVNGTSVGTYTLSAMNAVETFTISGINVEGSFTLKIVGTGTKQLVIDNVVWTGYTAS